MFSRLFLPAFGLAVGLSLLACGGGAPALIDPNPPFDEEAVVRISSDGSTTVGTANTPCDPNKTTCVEVKRTGDYCEKKDASGAADVVTDGDKILATICYYKPGPGGLTDVKDGQWSGTVDANGAVVTFDKSTDGKAQEGDLNVKGNRNVIYGNGSDKTILKGDASLEGNNHRTRGVTIDGDLVFKGNDGSIVLSVITGNLTYEGNNAVFADIVVFGNLTIKGNNHKLLRVFVAGTVTIQGENNVCNTTKTFKDDNEDGKLAEAEVSGDFTCDGTGKNGKP